MRLSITPGSVRVGDVEVHELSRVTELDAGYFLNINKAHNINGGSSTSTNNNINAAFSHDSLRFIETQLAIVIPCMNEEQFILDGVLHGVPHECLIILVSNSSPSNFKAECRLLVEFCGNAQRQGIAVHQKDEGLAHAYLASGMPELVETALPPGEALRIRNGKGEAMMIGATVAKLYGKRFVGFIDADNYVAGSVHEYCKVYAAGLHYALQCTGHGENTSISGIAQSATNPHSMVRIKWRSKPKPKDGKIVFETSGRSSRVVNKWMNRLLNELAGSNTQDEIIQTGNAGEHAMSIDLAMSLRFANGYAVEPFQLINSWEHFGPPAFALDQYPNLCTDSWNLPKKCNFYDTPPASAPTSPRLSEASASHAVRVLQIETRNPHFHDTSKGEKHIQRMQVQGLSTIYHSWLTPQPLKDDLQAYMKKEFSADVGVDEDGVPERARVYPPLSKMNFRLFAAAVQENASLMVVGHTMYGSLEEPWM
ncbi:mannosyl-3-phosphoglycerate synthase [Phaeosphaeriaceae sp. PMI808]|nr:mannosyl-3-phosphoglycerate synthase [Phaeosphaeriaceae sp. PMI808]